MKRLNEKDWEIIHWALSFRQIEEIQEKGTLILNKQQAIDTLKEDIRIGKETYDHIMSNIDNVTDPEMKKTMQICIDNGSLRNKEEQELIERLEKDDQEYEIGFVKGVRG